MPRTSASTTPSTSSRAPAGWSAATRGPRSPPAQVEPISSSSRSRPRTHCKLIGSQTDFAPHAPVFRGRTASRRDMEPNRNGNGLGRLAVFLPAQRSPPTGRLIRELRERDPAPVHRRHQRLERQFGPGVLADRPWALCRWVCTSYASSLAPARQPTWRRPPIGARSRTPPHRLLAPLHVAAEPPRRGPELAHRGGAVARQGGQLLMPASRFDDPDVGVLHPGGACRSG